MKIFVLLCALLLLTNFQAMSKTIDKNIKKTFKVDDGARLFLKHGDGDVTINSWSKDVINVKVIYRAKFSGIHSLHPDDFEVEFEQRGDEISIIGKEPRVIGIGSQRVLEYTYTINAPSYVELKIEGVDGDVDIENWDNNIRASIIDGDIKIRNAVADLINVNSIDGDIDLRSIEARLDCRTVDGKIQLYDLKTVKCNAETVDGDISIKKADGAFSARAIDGDISILDAFATDLDLKTTDGKISLDLNAVEDIKCRVKSGDGTIRIHLEEGMSTALVINTGDGRIRTDLSPISNLETDDNYFSGDINGGRGMIKIKTGDGNVDISEQ